MGLTRSGLVLAGLLVIALFVMVAPVSATTVTINSGNSIQDTINKASAGDTIVLNPGTYNQNGITVSKDISIKANTSAGGSPANTIIDAQGKWMFSSNSNSFVVDNLSLKNGCGGYGGAINAVGNVTIHHSAFTNFKAILTTSWGGAIYAKGTLAIDSSTFSDCSANQGGAIYSEHGGTISNSTFNNCSAVWGGAIDSVGDQPLSVSGSTFNNCKETNQEALSGEGGAISAKGPLAIDGSTFSDCSANQGGAIYSEHGGTISNSTFNNCPAGWGGAIDSVGNQPLSVSGSSFNNCSATGFSNSKGGAINAGGAITIDDSTFSDCLAYYGGGIYSSGDNSITVSGSTFINCKATTTTNNAGGAIYTRGTFAIDGSTFRDCSADYETGTAGLDVQGGAIYSQHGGTISNSTFSNCSAGWGGAIDSVGDQPLSVSGSTFNNCTATNGLDNFDKKLDKPAGGAIYAKGPTTIDGSTFSDCSANQGGAIYSEHGSTIGNSTFITCKADDGGAIYSRDDQPLAVSGSTFTGCLATGLLGEDKRLSGEGNGGAIYAKGQTTLDNSTFTSCSALLSGGAICSAGTTTVDNSIFSICEAVDGGGIFTIGVLHINSSSFHQCLAPHGSAINFWGNLMPDNSTLSNLHGCTIWKNGNPDDVPTGSGTNQTRS
jgi:hypothetical protein